VLARFADELIRQVTINCSERGLLLLRVRDEVRLTIAAYQTLYESSIAFGMRKALMAEQRKADMEQRIRQLQNQCDENETQVRNLQAKMKAVEENERKKREEEETKHAEQLDHFKSLNAQLKQTLENLLSVPTKK
jgi:dynein light intermediate chain